jgi:hypothetical protein
MPTLPLFDRSAAPGDWHAVTAPGGYEGWALDAEDLSTDTQVTIVFMTGVQQRSAYLRHYAAYRQSPTTTPPPVPDDYAGVLICIYRAGAVFNRWSTDGEVKAAAVGFDLAIGPSRLTRSGTQWKLSAQGVELTFVPTVSVAAGRPVLTCLRKLHEWAPVAARCDVSGTVDGATFAGAGSIEQAFGVSPVCFGLASLIRGRVFTADGGAMVFHIANPRTPRRPREATLVRVTPAGRDESNQVAITRTYADAIRFGEHLLLERPRIIHAHSRGTRIVYEAETPAGRGVAHCDVFYPQPPRRSFKKVLLDWIAGTE